jgi:hypothetical protein
MKSDQNRDPTVYDTSTPDFFLIFAISRFIAHKIILNFVPYATFLLSLSYLRDME